MWWLVLSGVFLFFILPTAGLIAIFGWNGERL